MARQSWIVVVLSICLCAPAIAQKVGQSVSVQYGTVVAAERTTLQSQAAKGAVVGGGIGLLTASGKSSSKKMRNALVGASVAGVASAAREGDRAAMLYTVDTGSGMSKIVTDQMEIRTGDCVAIEQGGQQANIRRMSPTACAPESKEVMEDPNIREELEEEAEECLAAKRAMLEAETDAELDRAARKIEILCNG